MRIAFATTLSTKGSTIIGRVIPLCEELSKQHEVHILLLEQRQSLPISSKLIFHSVGQEPFTRTSHGKKRLKGLALIFSMLSTAMHTARTLHRIKPDRIVIVKTYPHNVLGVWLWRLFNKQGQIILDVDDFELTATVLTSLLQRASIHWAERKAAQISEAISAASPFLVDHFKNLAPTKEISLILTGLPPTLISSLPAISDTHSQTLLYCGSLSITSGHRIDLLPEILEKCQLPDKPVRLLLAGSGDDEAKLRTEFEKRQLNDLVTWHGRFTEADIPELLKKSAIIIDPIDTSIAQRAKSSFRVMLALAAGWPLVTSNVGFRADAVPENWHHRFFAKPQDTESYAEKIRSLLQQYPVNNERNELRAMADQWSWHEIAKDFEKLL